MTRKNRKLQKRQLLWHRHTSNTLYLFSRKSYLIMLGENWSEFPF